MVIDGVFGATATGGVVFHAATGLEANAIAQVQAPVRRRLLRVFVRRGLLPDDDAQAMGQWQHGGGFSVDASVRIEATDREPVVQQYRRLAGYSQSGAARFRKSTTRCCRSS